MKKIIMLGGLLAAVFILLSALPREYGDTREYRDFVKIKSRSPSVEKTESMGENLCSLSGGRLRFTDQEGNLLWQSNPYWYVEDFSIFDVDGDGQPDCLFSLWKSYSFFEGSGKEDSPEVKNHLFLYTLCHDRAKALWCSSNLPRPILEFSLEQGEKTPVSSGAVLRTMEGSYQAEGQKLPFTYLWQGWGFVEQDSNSQMR